MGMAGKRRVELPQKLGITIAKLRSFAQAVACGVVKQDQAATGFGETVAFGQQSGEQVAPIVRKGKVMSEKRPQGSDEPLIRPDRRLRCFPAAQVARDRVADDMADRGILGLCRRFQGGKHRGGKPDCDVVLVHPATLAQDG